MEAHLQELRDEVLMEMKQVPDEQPVCEEPSPEMVGDGWWFVDDVSGAVLDASLVGEARQQELKTISDMQVWEVVPRPRTRR